MTSSQHGPGAPPPAAGTLVQLDDLRPGPDAGRDSHTFAAAMRLLKEVTGLSYRELSRQAQRHGDVLPRSTLDAVLSRDKLPREEVLAAFTRACGCPPDAVTEWLQVRKSVTTAHVDPPATTAPSPTLVPRQLPADLPDFAGRDSELGALDRLAPGDAKDPRNPLTIATIAGTAGVGKTALAIRWAYRVADHFPDGQLYVDLRGFDPHREPMPPLEAIRSFLDALEPTPQHVPAGLDAESARYRSLLVGRRMLILLDNARDSAQVRPLLPGAGSCLVIVTSRDQLSGLVASENARPLTLDLPSFDDAWALLARRLGAARLTTAPEATTELIHRCGRLPLALALAAARAITRSDFPIGELARELREAQEGLAAEEGPAALDDPDAAVSVRGAFDVSYHRLSAPAGELFRKLSLHPGPEISRCAAASLTATTPPRAGRLLAELTRAHLLVEPAAGRYAFHDLLRAYARALAHGHDHVERRTEATRRMLDCYVHTAHAASRLLNPGRSPIAVGSPPASVSVEQLDDSHGRHWFVREHPVLVALVRLAAETRHDVQAWQLAWSISEFLQFQGYWHEWKETQTLALDAARRSADQRAQAISHRLVAGANIFLRAYDEAHQHLLQALTHCHGPADRDWQGRIHIDLSVLLAEQGRPRDGLHHAFQAAEICHAEGDRIGEAHALNGVGWMYAQLSEYAQSLSYCQRALALQLLAGERRRQTSTWDSIGYAHHHLGHHWQATTCYQRALTLARESGDRHMAATILAHLGDTHDAAAETGAAHRAWRDALATFEEMGHPDAELVRDKLRSTHFPGNPSDP